MQYVIVIISFNFGKTQRVSFGEEDPFDEQGYADLIESRTREFPDGYVMVEQDGQIVGQIEIFPSYAAMVTGSN